MTENIQTWDGDCRDSHGIIHVIGDDREGSWVIDRWTGYEWNCAASLILFHTHTSQELMYEYGTNHIRVGRLRSSGNNNIDGGHYGALS